MDGAISSERLERRDAVLICNETRTNPEGKTRARERSPRWNEHFPWCSHSLPIFATYPLLSLPFFLFPLEMLLYNDPVTGVFTNRNDFFYFVCSRPEETLNGAGGSEKQVLSVEMTTVYYIYKVCLQMSWKILSVLQERNFWNYSPTLPLI